MSNHESQDYEETTSLQCLCIRKDSGYGAELETSRTNISNEISTKDFARSCLCAMLTNIPPLIYSAIGCTDELESAVPLSEFYQVVSPAQREKFYALLTRVGVAASSLLEQQIDYLYEKYFPDDFLCTHSFLHLYMSDSRDLNQLLRDAEITAPGDSFLFQSLGCTYFKILNIYQ